MKILLTAINAKYIHSNLAVYSLQAYAQAVVSFCPDIEIAEYTINQQEDDILRDIFLRSPDVLCLSCYIWNMECIGHLVREVKKILPQLPIWLGGPEVSYDAKEVLMRLPEVTGVMRGEGEQTFAKLCELYGDAAQEADFTKRFPDIEGIVFRSEKDDIKETGWRQVMDLNEIPFVYKHLETFENKIIYYESSRGCPFCCSYCLSSVEKRLRFREISLVKEELRFFLDRKVPQVKFVDRTFNIDNRRTVDIWEFIRKNDNGITNFHFEIAADIMDQEQIDTLGSMRPGLVQLEIGVQSTNKETIREINRTMDFAKVSSVVSQVKSKKNVHQHLDLIAGLPCEDLQSFARSFNEVYDLHPEQIQLGFLKVLKGSGMEQKAEKYGLVCKSTPPYEVLYTRWLSYGDILELKGVEAVVEMYYNSGQFTHTLQKLQLEFSSPYIMYRDLSVYMQSHTAAGSQHKRSSLYELMLAFAQEVVPEKTEYYRELLIYDYYLRENAKTRPAFAGDSRVSKDWLRQFYKEEELGREFLTEYGLYDRNQMRKMTHIEKFIYLKKTVLFDYLQKNVLNREARTFIIERN